MHDLLLLHLPFAGIEIFWPAVALLCFCAGLVAGFFGISGSWIIAPGLYILGFPLPFAIGTNMTQLTGRSLFSLYKYFRFSDVDFKLGATMLLGGIPGIEIGVRAVLLLERVGLAEEIVGWSYAGLLAAIIWLAYFDAHRVVSDIAAADKSGFYKSSKPGWKLCFRLFPVLSFRQSRVICSFWVVLAAGILIGFISGLLGVGGSLARMCILVYLLGCSTRNAFALDLLLAFLTGLYASGAYALRGRVDLLAALLIIPIISLGISLGAAITNITRQEAKKAAFMLLAFGSLLSVVAMQLGFVLWAGIFLALSCFLCVVYLCFFKGGRMAG